MSGHSQFKNIMYRKGAQDAKKARVFAKLARDITIAAKSGLPEPDKTRACVWPFRPPVPRACRKTILNAPLPKRARRPAATIMFRPVTRGLAPAR